jgi:two-component system OmpR family response regulator
MRILFVSPRHPEAGWLYKALHESAHSVSRSQDLADGIRQATREPFDAAILMANDAALCPELKATLPKFAAIANRAILIVILPNATAQERIAALHAGADACFARPLSFIEMHERLQALRRATLACRHAGQPAAARLQLDSLTRELVSGDHRLSLTKTEYLLIECLMRDLNIPVSHEQLVRYAWPGKDMMSSTSVSPLIWRLRSKLKTYLPSVHINTVNCYGYQLSLAPLQTSGGLTEPLRHPTNTRLNSISLS